MSKLLELRQKLNLTQEELFERSGISVRTIQRIEAGTIPKGYTLKALAKALSIAEDDLVEKEQLVSAEDTAWLKWINISALPFMILPPLNVAVPLLLMFAKKQFSPLSKKILTIQIVWTLIAGVLLLTVMLLNDVFGVRGQYMLLVPFAWLLVNAFIILRNAAEIVKSKSLRIDLKFSLI